MPSRFSLLFQSGTNPTNVNAASPHTGGWSESVWNGSTGIGVGTFETNLAISRAAMLPSGISIVGWRYENFTISGNKLLPGGASAGRWRFPGGYPSTMNLPQDALSLSGVALGAPNSNRFSCRGLPDNVAVGGEYQPDPVYTAAVDAYIDRLVNAWGFVGRVRTNQTARVISIVGGVVTLSANVGGTQNQSYLRLLRVRGDDGKPIKGTFLITNIAGAVYTLQGLGTQTATRANGLARIDEIAFFQLSRVDKGRAVIRKIGRPFESYRGRASRRAGR